MALRSERVSRRRLTTMRLGLELEEQGREKRATCPLRSLWAGIRWMV